MTEPSRVEPTLQPGADSIAAPVRSAHPKVRSLRTRSAMNRVLFDVAATMLAALALAYYLRAEHLPWLKPWLLAAGGVSVLRCLTLLAFQWTRGASGSGAWWRLALALEALLNGALWGALAVSAAIAGGLPVETLLLGLSFLVAVAVYTLAPSVAAFTLFILAALGPWVLQYVRLAYPSLLPPERAALLAQYLSPSRLDRADLLLLLGFVAILCLLYVALQHALSKNLRLAVYNAVLTHAQDADGEQRATALRGPIYPLQGFARKREDPEARRAEAFGQRTDRESTFAAAAASPPAGRPARYFDPASGDAPLQPSAGRTEPTEGSTLKSPVAPAANSASHEPGTRQADEPERKSLASFEAFHERGVKVPADAEPAFWQERRSVPQDEHSSGAMSTGALPDALLTQIDELLAYTSMNAGELLVESTAFELRDALRRAFAEPLEQARAKALQFSCTVAETVPDKLIGDCKKVQHSLANIVRNAVKFTASGTVSVEVTSAPRPDADGAVIRFTVTDTGIGMSAEQQQAVFAGLTKDNGVADYSPPSAGFGLAVAAGFIHAMHGTIEARSSPGQGSRFDVTIPFMLKRDPPPVKDAPAADKARTWLERPASAQPAGPSGSGPQSQLLKAKALPHFSAHILLAEDNPDNQMLALHLLKKQGFEVSIANNGIEAVAMAAANAFDLILMDVQMPEMGGLEATAKIRAAEQGSGRRVPIIAVTAAAQDEDRKSCLDAGMDDHVTKPLDRSTLFAAITAQLAGGGLAASTAAR